MTMQLFSFGHPCEHQLRRTCIGGSSCPLNGYPDNWCCSFIKGKINFKRDKPCEGPRCRWGFTHPSQAQFDAVTQVLNESRPIAAKIDDADDKEMLTFSIENARIVDTVQCALHMMRHPPSNCTTRVGQLLAYAALRAGDVKVFMQLLKTMKKPVDGYLLGAYEYLTSGNLPTLASSNNNNTNNSGGNTNNSNNNNSNSAQNKGSGKKGSADKKEDTVDELKNDMVDLMNAALSSGGQLVNREDQHTLQAVFIQALRSYPKSNKKRQEMLELAIAKFGNRPVPKNPSAVAAAVLNSNNSNTNTNNTATAATTNAANTTNTTTGHSPAAAAASGATTTTTTTGTTAAAVVAAGANMNINTTNTNTTTTTAATTAAAVVAAGTPGKTVASTVVGAGNAAAGSGQSPKTKETTEDDGTGNHHGGSINNNNNTTTNNNITSARRPQAVGGTTTTTATATTPFTASARLKEMTNPSPAKPQTQQTPQTPQPVVGISRLAMQVKQAPVRHYEPIRTDLPLPNIALFGGLFGLTAPSSTWALLGSASSHKTTNTTITTTSLATNTPSAVAAPSLTTATIVTGSLTTAITTTTTAPSTTTTTTTTANASPIPHPGVLPLELSGGVDDKVFGFLGSHAPDYSFFSDIDGVADD